MVVLTYQRFEKDGKTGSYGNKYEEFTISGDNVNSVWKQFEEVKYNNDVFRYMPLHVVNLHEKIKKGE